MSSALQLDTTVRYRQPAASIVCGMMRAARLVGPRRFTVEKTPLPDPGSREVRIRLEGCGVCGSNLATWQGRPWFKYPFDPGAGGHEGWGEVNAIGEAVQNVHLGERVAFLSSHAFAEYDIADSEQIVPVPAGSTVFPGEVLGCAVNIMRRSAIEPGHIVAVVGISFLGALLVQLAARRGARVIAISRRRFALEIGARCGAEATIAFGRAETVMDRMRQLTGKESCDRVIEVAGEQPTLDLASALTGEYGRLIIAGYHQDGMRSVNMQLWNWRGIDVINAHERDPRKCLQGMREAAELIAGGTLEPSALYTHSFTLDRLGEAFALMEERPEGFLKAWIRIA